MNTTTTLERVRYWQGQLFASVDLQTQMRSIAELRRLHNRAVHSAYGVAIGLSVSDVVDSTLPISCGLAHDCAGHELILPTAQSVPLPSPAITAPTMLTIGFNAALGEATLAWKTQSKPDSRDSVALARILPGIAGPTLDPDFHAVIARPLARLKLASGQTVPGNTAWEEWDENGVSVGVQTTIDTSTFGFTTTPNYFAQTASDSATADFVPAWFTSVSDPAPDSFTLKLFMRGITRESFDIVDPKTQVAATPAPGGKVSLDSGNVLAQNDIISRLLPVVSTALNITALASSVATLDNPVDGLTANTQIAFGNPPRVASVKSAPAAASGFKVTVDTPGNFQVDSIVAKLGAAFASTRPTSIASLDDDGGLEFASPITGLAMGDELGVASTGSLVTDVSTGAGTVTVQNPELFNMNDIVVCIDGTVENHPPAQVTHIAGAANEVLTLTPSTLVSAALKGLHIAVAAPAGKVQKVESSSGKVAIQVDQPKIFKTGDIVAKILLGGGFSEPVRVQSVKSSTKTITLEQAIPGLVENDQVGAADYRIRTTVQVVSNGGATANVANASIFPMGSYVVQLDDTYMAVAIAQVMNPSGGLLTLSPPIASLQAGDILALCSFPVTVTVEGIDASGTVQVDLAGLIKTGDVVASLPAHPGVTTVAAANGTFLQFAAPIVGLAIGDTLSVVTVSGVAEASPGASASKVSLSGTKRIRVGDFLATIDGWREPGPLRSLAYVQASAGTDLTLYSPLDGLMIDDTIGLASIVGSSFFVQLRLKDIPDLTPGDEALLVGIDRLTGETNSMFAVVEVIDPQHSLVYLFVEGNPGDFAIRPEDLSASVLFLRGSPLALVQDQNLYVNWLACQNPDPMPRPCPERTSSTSPCGTTVQI